MTLTDENGVLTLSAAAPPFPQGPLGYDVNANLVINYSYLYSADTARQR